MIINADDYGLNTSVNLAILAGFNQGWVNSTSIMANMPGFEEAVELAYQNKIQHQIGVHLVLTSGQGLTTGIQSIPFLFEEKSHLQKLFRLNQQQQQLIFAEFSAQIERVQSCGIPISHLDTHHQIHDVWTISQIMIKLLRTYKIPSMRILNNLEKSNWHKNLYRSVINRYLSKKGVNRSNFFGSRVDYLHGVNSIPDFFNLKKIEIMVHPDYDQYGKLIDRLNGRSFDLNFQREVELIS